MDVHVDPLRVLGVQGTQRMKYSRGHSPNEPQVRIDHVNEIIAAAVRKIDAIPGLPDADAYRAELDHLRMCWLRRINGNSSMTHMG